MLMRFRSLATVVLLALTSTVAWGPPKQKVLFDCDLGGDVDDAYAVALLLTSPEFEMLGLIMDHGNTTKRGQVACRLLYELGLEENIPVNHASLQTPKRATSVQLLQSPITPPSATNTISSSG